MVNVYDANQDKFVLLVAERLEKDNKLSMPEWAKFVKTGNNKERTPSQDNWWYLRAASILRKIYAHGPIGVQKLRTKYGSSKNFGYKPEKFVKSGGKVIRVIIQQLEEAGLVKQNDKTKRKGRVVTPEGASYMDKIAGELLKSSQTSSKDAKPAKSSEKEDKDVSVDKDKKNEEKVSDNKDETKKDSE